MRLFAVLCLTSAAASLAEASPIELRLTDTRPDAPARIEPDLGVAPLLSFDAIGVGIGTGGVLDPSQGSVRSAFEVEESEALPAEAIEILLAGARERAREGKLEEALGILRAALERDAEVQEVHALLALTLNRLERHGEALPHFERALELGPPTAALHGGMARAAEALGQEPLAAEHALAALNLAPEAWPFANNLAWLLATSEDPAVRDPERAIALLRPFARSQARSQPVLLDTLAASYAAAGRYDDAVRTAREAERLAQDKGAKALAARIRAHLDRYRAGRPLTATARR